MPHTGTQAVYSASAIYVNIYCACILYPHLVCSKASYTVYMAKEEKYHKKEQKKPKKEVMTKAAKLAIYRGKL